MNLDKMSKSILRNLFFNKEYQSLLLLADVLRQDIRNQAPDKESQWKLVQQTLTREGRAEGIKMFLDEIKKIANEEEKL